MDLKVEVEKILAEQSEEAKILEIYSTGSQIFRDTPSDLDYVVICEGYSQRRRQVVLRLDKTYDIMIYDKKAMLKQLDFNDSNYVEERFKLYNYFVCFRDTMYGNWDLDWNILDYEEDYRKYLWFSYDRTISRLINKVPHGKLFVHYYIPLKIFKNKKVEITEEMKQDILKLYEGGEQVLPIIEFIEAELFKIPE